MIITRNKKKERGNRRYLVLTVEDLDRLIDLLERLNTVYKVYNGSVSSLPYSSIVKVNDREYSSPLAQLLIEILERILNEKPGCLVFTVDDLNRLVDLLEELNTGFKVYDGSVRSLSYSSIVKADDREYSSPLAQLLIEILERILSEKPKTG